MPFRFPVKFDIPKHSYVNARVLRDQFKRIQYADNEVTRNALRYLARNTELPAKVRLEAQLQLTSMPKYTSYSQIKNRCVATGHSRSVISDFKLNRVCLSLFSVFKQTSIRMIRFVMSLNTYNMTLLDCQSYYTLVGSWNIMWEL